MTARLLKRNRLLLLLGVVKGENLNRSGEKGNTQKWNKNCLN